MSINTSKKGAYNPNAALPRAYHIKVAKQVAGYVTNLLQQDYLSQQKKFPMGIKIRFVPDMNTLISFASQAKLAQLTACQLTFEEKLDMWILEKSSICFQRIKWQVSL